MFALCNPNMAGLLQGEHPKFGPKVTHPPVDLSVGDIRSQIAAEWLQIAQRSQWRAYRKLPSLFLMVPSLTSLRPLFPPKLGFHMPPTYANGHISATGDPIHLMFGSIGWGFRGRRIEWPYLHNASRSTYIARIARSRASCGHLCDSTVFL